MMNMGSIAMGGGLKITGLKYYNLKFKQKFIATKDDILVVNTSVTKDGKLIGSAAIPELSTECLFTHHLYKVTPNIQTVSSIFLCNLINISRNRTLMWASGTTVDNIPILAISDLKFALPPDNLLSVFEKSAKILREKIKIIVRSRENLIEIRNVLLPRLMSGELKVN